MEAAPGALAAERNGVVSMPQMSSSSSRKEWRIVSEQSARNSGNQELEHAKLSQSEERLIYEVQNGREPLDVDFCSITIDGDLDNDILQQRLHSVAKQREELQSMEIEFRAQVIAKSEIVGLQNRFDAQMKDHSNSILELQEQLHEKEHKIHELERRMDDKERELHAVWAKEDLLREQSKELQSYMMERDNSEAERAQHIKQIHDLQEHIQEKESQFIELQEQHRIAQETINFKDEQIREAQTWITRAQEIDVLQTTTNHTLQAELRDRTEQYNQLWLVCQRQFGEMERLHLHLQQLQLEMADAREKSGSHPDGSHVSDANLNDASQLACDNPSQLEVNANSLSANTGSTQHDNTETSGGNTLTQTDQVQSVAFAPSSLFGMPTYLPPALHPFLMHQQGVPHPSHVAQSHFHSLPAMSSIQNWQGQGQQQALPDGEHVPIHGQYPEQAEGNLLRADQFEYKASVNGQVQHAIYLDSEVGQGLDANSVVPSQNEEGKEVHDSMHKSHDNAEPQNLQQISSQFDDAPLSSLEHDSDAKNKKVNPVIEHSHFAISESSSEASIHAVDLSETESTNNSSTVLISTVSTGQRTDVEKPEESYLMDERALLASIARTIGSGGRIKISSTLSNRLGRMIAPLHWYDYKRKYGKLDDFLASHPDLFLIEGDYIQLRDGAQATIAASAAVAKVAAIGPSSYSSVMPSVSLTPMAQSHRLKNVSSIESSSAVQNKNLDGKILSKSKDRVGSDVSETVSGQAPLLVAGTRTTSGRIAFSQNKGGSRRRPDNENCIEPEKIAKFLGIMRNARID